MPKKPAKVWIDMALKPKAPPEAPAEYITNTWSGHEHFECSKCSFDTLSKAAMLEHLVEVHDSEKALEELVREVPHSQPAAASEEKKEPQILQDDLKEVEDG